MTVSSVYRDSNPNLGFCDDIKGTLKHINQAVTPYASGQDDQNNERGSFFSGMNFSYVNINNSTNIDFFSSRTVNNNQNQEGDNKTILAVIYAIGLGVVGFLAGKNLSEYNNASSLHAQLINLESSVRRDYAGDGLHTILNVITAASCMFETIQHERLIGLITKAALAVGCASGFVGAVIASQGAIVFGAIVVVGTATIILFRVGYHWSNDPVQDAVGQVFLRLQTAELRDNGETSYARFPQGFKMPLFSTALA